MPLLLWDVKFERIIPMESTYMSSETLCELVIRR